VAGARNGLIFSSANGGASWNSVPFQAQFAGVLHALEVDPRSTSVWYVGMESSNAWTSGVFQTVDAGRSWTLLPETKGMAVWSLAVWPKNPDVMAAGTGDGVYLTRDRGATWRRISPENDTELRPVVSLAFDPVDSNTVYAGTTHLPWRTTDGGAKWVSIHEGMLDDSDVFSIQVDAQRPDRIFASACSGVYASSNGAAIWKRLETPKGAFRTHFVALAPKDDNTIFAGTTEGLLKSADGGRSWRKVSAESVKAIAFDPWVAGRIFFASPTGGLLVSTDGGNTLREANVGYTNRNFTTLTGAGNELYSSSVYEPASGGVYRTDNLALRWVHAGDPPAEQLLLMAAAPDNPRFLFAAGYHALLASADGGRTWSPRKGPSAGARITSLLPVTEKLLLAGTDQGLFRTPDGGLTWTSSTNARVESLRASGRQMVSAIVEHGAIASADEGQSWKKCGDPTPSAAWYGLDFDPAAPRVALAATPAGLFRSTDGCLSWTPVRSGLRAETATIVLFHPTHSGEAFVSQGGKVFWSTDSGLKWLPLDDDGPGNSGPASLFVLPAAPDRLFALFPRRGVFSTSIKEKPLQ
jgi:photosystem II stability/assembly factor-like uncharacterized protein